MCPVTPKRRGVLGAAQKKGVTAPKEGVSGADTAPKKGVFGEGTTRKKGEFGTAFAKKRGS